jgi:hypothetical protein
LGNARIFFFQVFLNIKFLPQKKLTALFTYHKTPGVIPWTNDFWCGAPLHETLYPKKPTRTFSKSAELNREVLPLNLRNLSKVVWKILASSLLLFIFLYLQIQYSFSATEEKWWVRKSPHFIIYYRSEPQPGFIEKFINEAEDYYRSILDTLGFTRFDFWTWENRCKIYLESTHSDYVNENSRPTWSRGHVSIRKREIKTYINKDLFGAILPHEMAHLIFREFVGYNRQLPLWLDEGIATLMEESREKRLALGKTLVKSKQFLSLEELTKINHETLRAPTVFYAEACSVVNFLLKVYGKRKFLDFCRCLRDERDWEGCLLGVYRFSDLSQMNKKWIEFLGE